MIRDIVAWYRSIGWDTIRWPPLVKGTKMKWRGIDFPPEAFDEGDNIGIKLGEHSGGLIDVDLDCPEAIALGPAFMPPTWTFGRTGDTKTPGKVPGLQCGFARHYLYLCPEAKTTQPTGVHIELRSTGLQTIVPGSIHPSGVPLEWAGQLDPAGPLRIDEQTLRRAFAGLALAVAVARSWKELEGNLHHLALAVAGALWHSSWTEDEAFRCVMLPAELNGCGDHDHLAQAVADTFSEDTARNRWGWPALEQLLGLTGRSCHKLVQDCSPAVPATAAPSLADGFLLNDSGNADRLIRKHGADMRFSPGIGWLSWDGTKWAQSTGPWYEMEIIAREMTATAATMPAADAKPLAEWARQTGNASRIRSALEIAENRPEILVQPSQLDTDPWTINALNGVIDLRTGALLPHDRAQLNTKQLSVEYDPSATCPRFVQFLHECMSGDQELVLYLLRYLGYALTADVTEHVLSIWHGPAGANGKSTLINVVRNVMGPYASVVAPAVLLQTHGEAHPTGLMDFRGRRFVAANEVGEGKRWNEALIKQLTGGDEVKARAMRMDFVEFHPTWKLIVATNARPLVREQGGSFWRRVHLVSWLASFKGREDKELQSKLEAEAKGILVLLVSGCLEWQRVGLAPPKQVLDAVNEYRLSQDMIGAYFDECVRTMVPDAFLSRGELYQSYKFWATSSGEYALPKSAFFRVLEERGHRFDLVNGIRGMRGWKVHNAGF